MKAIIVYYEFKKEKKEKTVLLVEETGVPGENHRPVTYR
jgi:hypothetical protein